jgi:hypothetical protein
MGAMVSELGGRVIGIQSFVCGNGHNPLGWSIDLHPEHARGWLQATPTPLSAVRNRWEDTILLHSLFLAVTLEGGVAYTFHSSFVPPPILLAWDTRRGFTTSDLSMASKAFGMGLSRVTLARAWSLCRNVVVIVRRTLSGASSLNVKFSIVHTYSKAGGE